MTKVYVNSIVTSQVMDYKVHVIGKDIRLH